MTVRPIAPTKERSFPTVWLIFVLAVTLGTRLVGLSHAPHFDEFYHMLAAESLLADGDLCIANCLSAYDRGAPFTVLVAGVLGLFGSSFVAARLVSVVAGLLLVGGVFWWTWRVAGRTAAVAASLLLALSPEAIYVSQFIRFYAWHGLLVWAGAAALYFAVCPSNGTDARRRLMLAAIGIAALLGAVTLQVTTLIAAVGIVVWLLVDPIARWARMEGRTRPGRLALIAGSALVFAAAGILLLERTGLLADAWRKYRSMNIHTADVANDIRFYHEFLMSSYPTLYSLVPVAFVVALAKQPTAVLLASSVFATALVLLSGGGYKATRFLFYAMPFFFALWGVALGVVLPPLVKRAREGVGSWLGTGANGLLAKAGGGAQLTVALLCVLATNPAYNTTSKMLLVSDAEWPRWKPIYRGRPEWRPAIPALREAAAQAEVVVSNAAVKSAYYLERVDAELTVSRLFLGPDRFAPDFARDPRLGVPVFRSPEAMESVVNCYRSGLIIVEIHAWETTWGVPPETAAYIVAHTEEIPLPERSDLRAFRWQSDPGAGFAQACEPPPLSISPSQSATG